MKTQKQLLDERMTLTTEMRGVIDAGKASAEGRLSAEQDQKVTQLLAQIDALTAEIEAWSRQEAAEKRLAEFEKLKPEPGTPSGGATTTPQDLAPELHLAATPGYYKGFMRHLARLGWADQPQNMPKYLTIQTDNDIRGGYTVVPEQFMLELIKNVDDETQIRGLARVLPALRGAVALSIPTRTAKASSAAWGAELEAPTADTALRFGKRQLVPHYFAGEIGVSRDWLRNSALDGGSIIRMEIARDSAELEENAFLTGSGEGRPLGLFTASAFGISTARDFSTHNSTTAIAADNLVHVTGQLKGNYLAKATWLFHRTVLTTIRKLKTGDGQYLWQPGLQAGQADSILGRPVVSSEFAPSTLTTGLYVGMLADFSNYWIVDDLDFELIQLNEVSARNNMVVMVYRGKKDGAPVKEEAFARVTLG